MRQADLVVERARAARGCGTACASTAAVRSFVEVLPFAPVIATTVASDAPRRSSRGELQQRVAGRSHEHGRPATSQPVAHERRRRADRERLRRRTVPPSVCSPGSATNSAPGRTSARVVATRRHLDVVADRAVPRRRARPRTCRRGLTAPSPSARAPRARRPVVERRSSGRRTPGPARGPCRRSRRRRPASGLADAPAGSPRGGRARSTNGLRRAAPAFARLDLGDDRQRVLGARVVARDDRQIGVRGRRRPHQGTLGAVAIATATEHDDHAPRRQRARRAQHVLDAIRRVRVIHHHQEILARLDRLDPAGHLPKRRRCPRRSRRRRCRAPREPAQAARQFATLNPPRSWDRNVEPADAEREAVAGRRPPPVLRRRRRRRSPYVVRGSVARSESAPERSSTFSAPRRAARG